jgi:hypothetical protein
VEEKELTNETLAITPMQKSALLYIGDLEKCKIWILSGFTHICRHPTGQHEKWSKDAMNRLEEFPRFHHKTNIVVDIPEF